MQPAIANLEVAMVAQPGQDPALQLASTGRSPVTSNYEKKDEPESKRGRSSMPPRMGKRTASMGADEPTRRLIPQPMRSQSASLRQSVWSGSDPGPETSDASLYDISASPPKVRIDETGWTTTKIVEQMEINQDEFRRSIQSMRDTIQTMYVFQQQQMVDLKDVYQKAQMQ